MGTHPIFESDFDCLTESKKMLRTVTREARRFQPRRFQAALTELDMHLSVANAANYKRRLTETDEQLPYRPLYMDNAATTPLDPRVVDAMLPFNMGYYGNPHSSSHAYGWQAEAAVEHARKQVAQLIGAEPSEIIFTSGATESNNLAIKGAARFYGTKKKHIITSQIEHKCILDSCRYLEATDGFKVTYLKPEASGRISVEQIEEALTPETVLVSIMAVNNEVGVQQDIAAFGALCKSKKVHFHTDAAQMVGKIPIDVKAMNISMMSLSVHKIYGPKGIGAIYVSKRPRVRLEPLISGGGQERGLRLTISFVKSFTNFTDRAHYHHHLQLDSEPLVKLHMR